MKKTILCLFLLTLPLTLLAIEGYPSENQSDQWVLSKTVSPSGQAGAYFATKTITYADVACALAEKEDLVVLPAPSPDDYRLQGIRLTASETATARLALQYEKTAPDHVSQIVAALPIGQMPYTLESWYVKEERIDFDEMIFSYELMHDSRAFFVRITFDTLNGSMLQCFATHEHHFTETGDLIYFTESSPASPWVYLYAVKIQDYQWLRGGEKATTLSNTTEIVWYEIASKDMSDVGLINLLHTLYPIRNP